MKRPYQYRPSRRVGNSRGRLLLLAVLQRTSAREVAARCRVTASFISYWVSDVRSPGDRVRAVLESIYGIPSTAWDEPISRGRS